MDKPDVVLFNRRVEAMNAFTCPIRGDISRADAVVLNHYARLSPGAIIECGCGGSTFILAGSTGKGVVTFENNPDYMQEITALVEQHEAELRSCPRFELIDYQNVAEASQRLRDEVKRMGATLAFVDGYSRELCFAALWQALPVGAIVMIHDSRMDRGHMAPLMTRAVFPVWDEVLAIRPNYLASNICVVEKGCRVKYENWNLTETENNREFTPWSPSS